jgi:hypothetical protein
MRYTALLEFKNDSKYGIIHSRSATVGCCEAQGTRRRKITAAPIAKETRAAVRSMKVETGLYYFVHISTTVQPTFRTVLLKFFVVLNFSVSFLFDESTRGVVIY